MISQESGRTIMEHRIIGRREGVRNKMVVKVLEGHGASGKQKGAFYTSSLIYCYQNLNSLYQL